jgi:hypothetical protein
MLQGQAGDSGSNQRFPKGFLPLSEALNRLTNSMWGGVPDPLPVRNAKKDYPSAPIRFEPWRNRAAKRLRNAATTGRLKIYVVADPELAPEKQPEPGWPSPPTKEPIALPLEVLKRLITRNDMLPDHAINPTLKATGGDRHMYVLLRVGMLVARESDLDRWHQSERARYKWPSQRFASKRASGRPRKYDRLRKTILDLVKQSRWTAKDGYPKLRRVLFDSGSADLPSVDTLERLGKLLLAETGRAELLRSRRRRRGGKAAVTAKSP